MFVNDNKKNDLITDVGDCKGGQILKYARRWGYSPCFKTASEKVFAMDRSPK